MYQETRSPYTHQIRKSVVKEDELRQHLVAAGGQQLLLTAVHVTGNTTLLDTYASQISTDDGAQQNIVGKPFQGAVSPKARAELTELICSVLTKEEQGEYLGVEDRSLFSRMASLAAGTQVPEEELGMLQEQSGFVPDGRAIVPTRTPPKTLNLAIIGAGMTGLDAAVKASERGFEFEVFARESGIGGLWWSQTYPGVGVDTPSMFYSLSYEVTPDWSRYYPIGEEYRSYLTELAKKYRLNERINLNSEVTRMQWLAADQAWELTILDTVDQTTRTVRAAAILSAAGHLNRPKYPDIDGLDTFAGESVHTASWRDVDLDGKRVGVVGVGAAGVQVIASIADKVDHLFAFQRQAHWVIPNTPGAGLVSESEQWLRRHLPYFAQWSRFQTLWMNNSLSYVMNRVDEEWTKTHRHSISAHNAFMRQTCMTYINETFGEGSELARKLTPDFMFGAKRPVRDPSDVKPGGYYYALSQPNATVISDALTSVVPEGIVTADGTIHELDVIIWATGMTLDFLSTIDIVGRDGIRLKDVWANNNPRTYLGGTVPGFPNLFINDGPNTGAAVGGGGHNFMTETIDHYAFECLQLAVERGATSIEISQQAHDAHNELIEERMLGLLWHHDRGADTYYRNQAGRIVLPSPFPGHEFWEMCQKPDESAFILLDKDRFAGLTHD